MRLFHQESLSQAGYQVATALTGREAAEQCQSSRPDLIVADARLLDLEALSSNDGSPDGPLPVLLMGSAEDAVHLARLPASAWVMSFLAGPVSPAGLLATVTVAVRQFAQAEALRREAIDLRQALEDRKIIERAKGALTRRLGVDEDDAFRRLRKVATGQNIRLVEAARKVLDAEAIFRSMEEMDSPAGKR
jgi:response regulator NasT